MNLLPMLVFLGAAADDCGPIPAFVEAFNAQDLDRMVALLHPKAGWHYLQGGEVFSEARGQAAIRASMEHYFRDHVDTRSAIGPCQRNGPFISTVETASWGPPDDRRSQSAMAVYRLKDDLIREVYYFPAVKVAP